MDIGINDPVADLGAEEVSQLDNALPGRALSGAFDVMQAAVDASGIGEFDFSGQGLSAMNGLRAELFERAGWTGADSPLADWALVSDRYLLSAAISLTIATSGGPFTPARRIYKEVRAISRGSIQLESAAAVTHVQSAEVQLGNTSAFGPASFQHGGHRVDSGTVTFDLVYPTITPPQPDPANIVGDTSLFSAFAVETVTPVHMRITGTLIPSATPADPYVLDFEYRLVDGNLDATISRTIGLNFGKGINDPTYEARVISRTGAEWNAYEVPDVYVTAADGTTTLQHTASILGAPETPYWTARMGPVGIIGYASYASPAELWNRQQWSDAANFPGPGTPELGDITRPRTYITSAPTEAGTARHWLPHARSSAPTFPDTTRAAAAWPDYYEISITVPDTLQAATARTFSPYRFSYSPAVVALHPDRCSFYEIPLEVTPELERFVEWDNNNPNRTAAKSYRSEEASGQVYSGTRAAHGTQEMEHFHDQRIVSADGGKFWYRDAFTVLPADLAQQLRRFPAWTIERTGDAFTLFLLVPEHDIVIGYETDGTPITEAATYWPSGRVTPSDYRDHYLQHGGIFVGTWPDFVAPYRFFNTSLDGPVAGWTVDKTIGGAWTPGESLKLYLPKCTTRSPTTYFQVRRQTALDANVALTQSLLLPSYSGPSSNSEVHNLQMRRARRRFATLVFRNDQCTLATEAMDLRLFVPNQQDIEERPPLYDWPQVEDWRDLGFAPEPYVDGRGTLVTPGAELNMGDFYFDRDTNTIHLNRTDKLADDGDEFLLVSASFEADSSAECVAHIGQLIDGTVPETFVPLRECTIPAANNASERNFYLNSDEVNGNAYSPKWILHDVWPIAYQRRFAAVTVGVSQTDHTYSVPSADGHDHSIDGKLVRITTDEDVTLAHEIGWRAKIFRTYSQINEVHFLYGSGLTVAGQVLESGELALSGSVARYRNQFWNHTTGEQLTPIVGGSGLITLVDSGAIEPDTSAVIRIQNDRYATTETNLLQGAHYIHPKTARTTEADRYGRLFYFQLLEARQNWRVDVAWREIFPDPTVQPEIIGVPFACHFNETMRLLRAWIAAGKP